MDLSILKHSYHTGTYESKYARQREGILGWYVGFHGGSDGKESCNSGDTDLIPGSGRSPGEENGNPL